MKNPNGYGCIRLMSGNRRRPYAFIATINGRQKYIAAFETIYDAKVFQAKFFEDNHRDFLPSHKKISFAELYFRWLSFHKDEDRILSRSTLTGYEYAYSHCSPLYDKCFPDLQYLDLQAVINCMRKNGLSYSSCKKVKNLLSLMYKYAIKANICRTNYALLLSIGRNHPVKHVPVEMPIALTICIYPSAVPVTDIKCDESLVSQIDTVYRNILADRGRLM